MRALIVITALLGLALSGQAFAAIFNVGHPADVPDLLPGDGKCSFVPNSNPGDPGVCTLRAAIMEANATAAHDTIVLPDGGYVLLTRPGRDEDNAVTGDLDIRQPVTIRPPVFFGVPGNATVDANGLDRVFDIIAVQEAGVHLKGLTIKGGDPGDENISAGGIDILDSKVDLSFLDVSTVAGNGVGSTSDTTTIGYSTIKGSAEGNYDAVWVNGALINIESSALIDSSSGLSVQNSSAHVHINNSTLSGNSDTGIDAEFGAKITVTNSTIAHNGHNGARVSDLGSVIVATHSIFASNGGNCLGFDNGAFVMHNNLYDDHSCPSGGAGDNSMVAPAFLSPLGDHGGPTPTHRPMTNSPALDVTAAMDCADNEFDQRLMPRPVAFTGGEARCDLGAVELESDVVFFDPFERL